MVDVLTGHIISGIFEFILFGIFFVLSTASLFLLVRRHQDRFPGTSNSSYGWRRALAFIWRLRKSPLIAANILLMCTVTAHMATSARRLILAFVYNGGHDEEIDFLNLLEEKTQVIRLVLLFIDMFIGDLVITYRVWLVWEHRLGVIALPALTTVALLATGIGMIHQFLVSKPTGSVFDPIVTRWITAYCVMTFLTNIYGTIVIAYRIWATNRLLKNTGMYDGTRSLLETMAIFVESAALYAVWGVFYVVVYGTKSHLEIIGTGCAPTVLGVTFMLITVRVGLGWAQESRVAANSLSSQSARAAVISALSFRGVHTTTQDETSISLAPTKKDPGIQV
ncbi:hypothetical protein L226DRAFT_470246 [Lentinus tigrinus ALCF2SS1-7]|uniref:Uncharacterized protein n=1 Tax=Lentinus tigrinus ALCF2SS1-6 TaxID=1328759 RepID=A0A5C2S383_9APHY|nr:hypothetical protein L227DRAFT_505869 [Lentinus tigrinus ALCF2SS1-6]RPD70417.1 hypothetical protein L226DRAFT_470246 [Lentinus tigrinus ALCF2SS1-7]